AGGVLVSEGDAARSLRIVVRAERIAGRGGREVLVAECGAVRAACEIRVAERAAEVPLGLVLETECARIAVGGARCRVVGAESVVVDARRGIPETEGV